jgi:hypothetical protein
MLVHTRVAQVVVDFEMNDRFVQLTTIGRAREEILTGLTRFLLPQKI